MPTFEPLAQFLREYRKLSEEQRQAFQKAVGVFRSDLADGDGFRPGLRVKKMSGHDIWELSWAPDGRATFTFGESIREGHRHIVWRRIGGHEIFEQP